MWPRAAEKVCKIVICKLLLRSTYTVYAVCGFSAVLEQRKGVGKVSGHSKRGDAQREKRGLNLRTSEEKRSDGVEKEQAKTGWQSPRSSEPAAVPVEHDGKEEKEEEERGNPFAEVFSESEASESEG